MRSNWNISQDRQIKLFRKLRVYRRLQHGRSVLSTAVVTVRSSKEAADTKLTESLRVFAILRLSQPQRLHDDINSDSLSDELIASRGYAEIAWQHRDYKIPECNILGVFMTQKMRLEQN